MAGDRDTVRAFSEAAVEHSRLPIIGIGPDGRLVYVNGAASLALGYTRGELLDLTIHDIDLDLGPERWFELWKSMKARIPHIFESRHRTKDGRVFPVEVTANHLEYQNSSAVCAFVRDITQQQQAKEELRAAMGSVEEASRAKSAFLANMSHEIRTPMNAIIGLAELLWETPMSREQRKYVRIVRRAGSTLLALLNDILDLSKVEAGRLDLEHIPFDLEDVLDKALEMMSMHAHEKSLDLAGYIAPDVPCALVGDPNRLQQILVNLLSNAIKFTASGEVIVRVERDPVSAEPETLRFSVSDTGLGIPQAKLDSIFDTFSQAHSSAKYRGTGLGLAIAKQLANLMEGAIWVQSEEGKGSTFTFTVRLGVQKGDSDVGESTREHFQGLHVLVADPSAINRLILKDALQAWGARVLESGEGDGILAQIEHASKDGDPYHLVILDSRLPDTDIFQLARSIQADSPPPSPAVMVLTSGTWADDIARTYELGIAGYLVKPIRRPDLHQSVSIALKKARGAGPVHVGSERARPPMHLEPLSILLVEDSPDNQLLILSYLDGAPYRIDVAENGQIGSEKFKLGGYDLVIMDLHMPVMDGYTATKVIRTWEQQQGWRPIPVIALTAYAVKDEEAKSLSAGCTAHLTKPIKKSTLLEAIISYTDGSGT